MGILYNMVKEVQAGYGSEETLIRKFEPKIKSSLRHTTYKEQEDLEQELKMRVIHYIRDYNVDDVPGLSELNKRKAL